ncbi:family 43 glycosylhydrolase [Allokutzneria sp. NRRL B-24872]|uniref:family 43 glycosylhydrolase n=1 Tax=Allokutzneria sp. NRRL B-24872 TaxID=1137961 RepID=UPI000A37E85E|nr:family 43 glycosylhydrolase [Allokutzneria sp. NRRL B-24872]
MRGWGSRLVVLVAALAVSVAGLPGTAPPARAAAGEVVSIRSHNFPNAHFRHADWLGRIADVFPNSADLVKEDATWELRPGLASSNCLSLEARNYKNHYLRHRNGEVVLERYSEDFGFRQDATFCKVPGLADANGFSLRALQFPNAYLRHAFGLLKLNDYDGGELFRQDATFHTAAPWITGRFYNPILNAGADPSMVIHNGQYNLVQGDFYNDDDIVIRQASTVEGLRTATPHVVWRNPACPAVACKEIWAPELQRIGDRWWIFFTGQDGSGGHTHRMYALRSTTSEITSRYDFLGEQKLPGDTWAIDGVYLTHQGKDYYLWSGWESQSANRVQHLYIARMQDPMTPIGDRVRISSPTQPWETLPNGLGILINEGPQPIVAPNGRLSVVYSANGSFTNDYCLGRLTLDGDPMNPAAWTKSGGSVFSGVHTATSPGHHGFVTIGGSPWIVYHANMDPGTGWPGRSVRIQPMSFDAAGLPVLGVPTYIHQGIPLPR